MEILFLSRKNHVRKQGLDLNRIKIINKSESLTLEKKKGEQKEKKMCALVDLKMCLKGKSFRLRVVSFLILLIT